MGLNTYFIRGGEVLESSLETIDSSLTQSELDQILAFSMNQSASAISSLSFHMNGKNLLLESSIPVEKDELYSTRLPLHSKLKWPTLLRGIPASIGLTTGEAVRLEEFDLEKCLGKILISPGLDVRNVKSLKGIKAIVLESGNIMSHIGILTRELSIPCVMGIKDAKIIPDGAVIVVDGMRGLVNQAP